MIIVYVHEMLKACKLVHKSAMRGGTLPILASLRLRLENKRMEVLATNLETVSRAYVGICADVVGDSNFEICLPDTFHPTASDKGHTWGSPLIDYLTVLKEEGAKADTVQLDTPATHPGLAHMMTLHFDRQTARFIGLSASDFPFIDPKLPEGPLDKFKLKVA